MAIVEIKGVGKAQFPDGMSAESIRDFLRKKYYQQRNNSDILQPVDNIAAPYEPTLTEKIGQNVASALTGSGLVSDNYGAQQVGKNVTALGEFLPGIGDATAGDEFGRAVAKGDKFGMAMAGLGVIPIAGDLAKKAFKGANPVNINDTIRNRFKRPEKVVNLPQGNVGSSEFDRIKEIDPSAKVLGRQQDGSISVSYLDEYKPKKVSDDNPYLFEFDPDALEITENETKRIDNYKGRSDKPISVTKKDGDYFILDGHHRAKIAKEKSENVKAVVIPFEDVEKMKKENIHQGDMLKEWVASKPKQASQSLPMDEVKQVTSYNDMFDFTPEQMAQQLRSSKPENVVDGVYIEPTNFGEKRFNPDGSIEIVKDGSILRRIDPQDSDMAYKNKIMKNESEKPEVKAIQEKRKADFDAERARQQAQEDDTYKMQHTAPTREDNSSGDDLTDTFGSDIYSSRALQYFGTGSSYDNKAIRIIQGMKGKPEKAVTIYRAVPKDVNKINASDWVTTTKEYAQDHMEGEKGWHILSKKVKAKDIATDGNSIHEFGYDPVN